MVVTGDDDDVDGNIGDNYDAYDNDDNVHACVCMYAHVYIHARTYVCTYVHTLNKKRKWTLILLQLYHILTQ